MIGPAFIKELENIRKINVNLNYMILKRCGCQLDSKPTSFFSFSSMLEKNLRQLMDCVDEVAMDANRFLNYQRQYNKQSVQKQQFLLKRVGL